MATCASCGSTLEDVEPTPAEGTVRCPACGADLPPRQSSPGATDGPDPGQPSREQSKINQIGRWKDDGGAVVD